MSRDFSQRAIHHRNMRNPVPEACSTTRARSMTGASRTATQGAAGKTHFGNESSLADVDAMCRSEFRCEFPTCCKWQMLCVEASPCKFRPGRSAFPAPPWNAGHRTVTIGKSPRTSWPGLSGRRGLTCGMIWAGPAGQPGRPCPPVTLLWSGCQTAGPYRDRRTSMSCVEWIMTAPSPLPPSVGA